MKQRNNYILFSNGGDISLEHCLHRIVETV